MLTRVVAGLLASLLPVLVQAEVYKWVDAEGRTHYSNVPPKNVKTRRVEGGGVTVVPALVVPPVAGVSAPQAAAPVAAGAPARVEPETLVSAPAGIAPAAAASAIADGEKAPAPAASVSDPVPDVDEFKPMPGWSQPPIRPRGSTPQALDEDGVTSSSRNKKNGSVSSPPAAAKAAAPVRTFKQD